MSLQKHPVKLVDTHYLALWDKKDLPLIEKLQAKIRNHERLEELTNIYFKLLEDKWNDHKPRPEALDVAKDEKYVMTYRGVARCCRLIAQQSNIGFRYLAIGTGAPADAPPLPFETSLTTEEDKVLFSTNGFFEAPGTSIRYAGTFGADMITDNYNESLVRTHENSGDSGNSVLCIAYFFDQPISHTQGSTGFTAAGSIDFQIIADIPMV